MPFVVIQVIMVGLIIAFPELVSGGLDKDAEVDVDKAFQQMQMAPKESQRRRARPAAGAASSARHRCARPRRRRDAPVVGRRRR